MKRRSVSTGCACSRIVRTSSKVPNPPGKPIKAPERFAISILRSCIELTTIWWVREHVSEQRTRQGGHRKAWCARVAQATRDIHRFHLVVGRASQHSKSIHNDIHGPENPRIRTSPLCFSSNRSAIAFDFGWPLPLSFSPPAAWIAYGMIPVTLPPSRLATAPDTTPMMPVLPPPYMRGRFAAASACATAV